MLEEEEFVKHCHFILIQTRNDNPVSIAVNPDGMWSRTMNKWRTRQQLMLNTLHDHTTQEGKALTKRWTGTQYVFSQLYKPSFDASTETIIQTFIERLAFIYQVAKSSRNSTQSEKNLLVLAFDILDYCGIMLDPESKLTLEQGEWKHPYQYRQAPQRHFKSTNSGYPEGLFSSILYDLSGANTYKLRLTNDEFERRNPLFWNRDVMLLARLACEHSLPYKKLPTGESFQFIKRHGLWSIIGVIYEVINRRDEVNKRIQTVCTDKKLYFILAEKTSLSGHAYELLFLDEVALYDNDPTDFFSINSLSEREFAVLSWQLYLNNRACTFFDYIKIKSTFLIHHNVESEHFDIRLSEVETTSVDGEAQFTFTDYTIQVFKQAFRPELQLAIASKSSAFPLTAELNKKSIEEYKLTYLEDLLKVENDLIYTELVNDFLNTKVNAFIEVFSEFGFTPSDLLKSPVKNWQPSRTEFSTVRALFNGQEFYKTSNGVVIKSRFSDFLALDPFAQSESLLDMWVNYRLSEWCFRYTLKLLRHIRSLSDIS